MTANPASDVHRAELMTAEIEILERLDEISVARAQQRTNPGASWSAIVDLEREERELAEDLEQVVAELDDLAAGQL